MTIKQGIAALLLGCCALQASADNSRVVLHTSKGPITIELYDEQAPLTVANFLHYARSGFYDGTLFHRVKPRFVIQGGGFTADMVEKQTGEPVPNESKNRLHNERWTVAMARTKDPDSATSQFFINLRMNLDLDYQGGKPGYTVFGIVTDGQHVVREISLVATRAIGNHEAVPVEPVLIERAEILP